MVVLPVTAVETDGDTLTYTALNLPDGLSIDPSTGLISGDLADTAAETNGGLYSVTVMATDGTVDSGSVNFSWTVTRTNHAPTLVNPGDRHDAAGSAVSFPVYASDPDVGQTLTFSATGLPAGISLDPTTGIVSGTLASAAVAGSPYP